MKMDLSKFKYMSSDGKSTTLKHPRGHVITIAHSSLEPEHRAAFEAMAKGASGKSAKAPKKLAKGGEVSKDTESGDEEMLADGGETAPDTAADAAPPEASRAPASAAPVVVNVNGGGAAASPAPQAIPVNLGAAGAIPSQFINPHPGAQAAASTPPAVTPSNPAANPPDLYGVNPEEWAKAHMPAEDDTTTPGPDVSQPPQQQAGEGQPPQSAAYSQLPSIMQGFQEQRRGIQGEAQAQGQMGKEEAQTYQENAQQLQNNQDVFNGEKDRLMAERKNILDDIQQQHIDPTQYISRMGTGQKIATAIGLVLGGLGGGLNKTGVNPALQFLNQQIDRNIDAQKAELGKKENLLSANFRQFQNVRDAADFTRINMLDHMRLQVAQAAAKAQDPLAKARALQLEGQLDQNAGVLMAKVHARQVLESPQAGPQDVNAAMNTLRMVDPAQAKEVESRYVPGVGIASVPVPNEVRDKIIAKQTLQRMSTDFYSWAKQHSGSLDPRVVNEGKTKAAELQSLYRNSINGGVFKKGEQEFIDNIVDSDPTKFFNNIRVLPKLREVINSNNNQLGILKRGYGLKTPQAPNFTPAR